MTNISAAMTNVKPEFNLWLKTEPFSLGALPGPPARLTTTNIKKIIPYAKTKCRGGYPNLSYSVWKHVACNKLQLPDDVAWSYFMTFDLIHGRTQDQRLEWDRLVAKAVDQNAIEMLRHELIVPCQKFVLFLYIQHIHKISLRASLVSGSDEWPLRARSPDPESRTNAAAKELDENSNLSFILNNLNEILELLTEQESKSAVAVGKELSLESVEALDLLMEGSTDGNRSVKTLHEIAQSHGKSGFSKASRTFSFRSFQSWLKTNLSQNPFGVAACIAQGRHLCWPMAGESKEKWVEKKKGRIATNASFVTRDHVEGNKLIVMSQVSKMTVARSSATLEGSTVKIHRCHDAFIYLLSPLRSVSIEKCQRSTIVLGAVELSVDLVRCEQTTIIAVCRRFTTVGSKLCAVHVLTPNRPLVFGGSESLMFGPYHTHYPKLEEHMEEVGLGIQPNLWDKPLYMDTHSQVAVDQSLDESSMWEIQNPSAFYTFTIPFEMEGDTKAIPGGLPTKYMKALSHRRLQVATWQSIVQESKFSAAQRKTFQGIVSSRFQDWLQVTGNDRQLEGLVPFSSSKLG